MQALHVYLHTFNQKVDECSERTDNSKYMVLCEKNTMLEVVNSQSTVVLVKGKHKLTYCVQKTLIFE